MHGKTSEYKNKPPGRLENPGKVPRGVYWGTQTPKMSKNEGHERFPSKKLCKI